MKNNTIYYSRLNNKYSTLPTTTKLILIQDVQQKYINKYYLNYGYILLSRILPINDEFVDISKYVRTIFMELLELDIS